MKTTAFLFALLTFTFSSAQLFDNLDDVLEASLEDAQSLVDAYVQPLGQSFTYSLNSGWSSSAKTHKKLGFDLTIGVTSPSVSDDAKRFNIASLGLKQLTSTSPTASTIFGPSQGTDFTITPAPGSPASTSITLPGGLEDDLVMNSLPIPFVQAGLGLFFDTDLMVRYIPKIKNQGGELSLIGVGLKHNLMQYFGPLDKLPLNVSALASFSKLDIDYSLNDTRPDQKVTYGVNTFLVQGLASIDFPIISVVGGIGYGKGDATLRMLGDYTNINATLPNNPLTSENTYTGAHALIGARLNLLIFKIFANYTIQEFNTLTAGVSLNFR